MEIVNNRWQRIINWGFDSYIDCIDDCIKYLENYDNN